MKILIVNDDGIASRGIIHLARMAVQFGEVTVAAPASQCSAMSHRLTVFEKLLVKPEPFPVEGVSAWSVNGTPADCVKVGLMYLAGGKTDILFSGINEGLNTGRDILYSGTIGAAMEGIANGVPSIAFSCDTGSDFALADEQMPAITREILGKPAERDSIWNINFPACAPAECRGIRWERKPAQHPYYLDNYRRTDRGDGSFVLEPAGYPTRQGEAGSDIEAILDNCISVGLIRSTVVFDMPKA